MTNAKAKIYSKALAHTVTVRHEKTGLPDCTIEQISARILIISELDNAFRARLHSIPARLINGR